MASELDSLWGEGQVVVEGPPSDMADNFSDRSKKSSTAGGRRAKRGKATTLSSSFTSWKLCPETR